MFRNTSKHHKDLAFRMFEGSYNINVINCDHMFNVISPNMLRSSNTSTFQKTALHSVVQNNLDMSRCYRTRVFSWKNLTPTSLEYLVLSTSHCHDSKCHILSSSVLIIDVFNVEYSKCKKPHAERRLWKCSPEPRTEHLGAQVKPKYSKCNQC